MIVSWTSTDPAPVVHKKRYVCKSPKIQTKAVHRRKTPKKYSKTRPKKTKNLVISKPCYPCKNARDHYVYVLHTKNSAEKSVFYTGYTIDLGNRIRQHNKEKSGGASYTSRFSGWEYLCFISGFRGTQAKTTALQCEYKLKKTSGSERSKSTAIHKRVSRIASHMHGTTFTSKSVKIASLQLTIHWVNKKAWEQVSKLSWPENVSHKLHVTHRKTETK